MEKTYYLVAHKVDGTKAAWLTEGPQKAFKEAEDMMRDHGGSTIVTELDALELATIYLKDWFTK